MSFFGFGGGGAGRGYGGAGRGPGRGGGNKRKATESSSGTGYGGAQGDTKKLLAGRKKAEKASSKDDKTSIRFLKTIQKQLKYQESVSKGGCSYDLDESDKSKVSSLLANIFRNQVPTDWDERKELYNVAFDVARTLASNETLGKIFGDKDDQEGVLFWLLDFSQQAEQIMNRNAELGWTKEDQDDVMLATQVSEVADAALKISRRCQASKPEAELSVITLSERYQSELGPLRFDSVESMQNVRTRNRIIPFHSLLITNFVFCTALLFEECSYSLAYAECTASIQRTSGVQNGSPSGGMNFRTLTSCKMSGI